jgi:cell division septum initiation protein DivIVA
MNTSEHIFGFPQPDADGGQRDAGGAPSAPDRTDDSRAAARLLEMTAREIDRWRSEAEQEAAGIVAAGRDEAAGLVQAAREEAERLVGSARDEAARTVNDARAEAYQVRQEATAAREQHDAEIARLQGVEAEHRQRLRQHLTDMLGQVDGGGAGDR